MNENQPTFRNMRFEKKYQTVGTETNKKRVRAYENGSPGPVFLPPCEAILRAPSRFPGGGLSGGQEDGSLEGAASRAENIKLYCPGLDNNKKKKQQRNNINDNDNNMKKHRNQ